MVEQNSDSKTAGRELIRVNFEYRRAALEAICPEGIFPY
jgi:hypothetical protein